jgi:6,7-dimethyl-8-ribityllumazine synthase
MSTKNKNLSSTAADVIDGKDLNIGIVVSDWNEQITSALHQACIETLIEHGVKEENIHCISVPGAYELPLGAKLLAGKEKLNAIVCLGCVIKGDTKHDEYISNAVANGIMTLNIASSKPIIFGLLTPNTMEQALDRAGGKHGNKGVEAAMTALKMANLSLTLKDSRKGIGFS